MSIINEALRKTQQSRKQDMDKRTQAKEKQQQEPTMPHATLFETPVLKETVSVVKKMDFMSLKRGGFFTVTLLFSIVAYVSFQHARNPALPIVQAAITPTKEKMAFSGIFVSDNSKIAVINKQSYHLGDMVNGMEIVAINQDSVHLRRDGKVILIRPGSTYLI